MDKPRRKPKQKVPRHPVSPLPSTRIRLRLLTRNTYATDFGLDAIFARVGARSDAR